MPSGRAIARDFCSGDRQRSTPPPINSARIGFEDHVPFGRPTALTEGEHIEIIVRLPARGSPRDYTVENTTWSPTREPSLRNG